MKEQISRKRLEKSKRRDYKKQTARKEFQHKQQIAQKRQRNPKPREYTNKERTARKELETFGRKNNLLRRDERISKETSSIERIPLARN